MKRLSLRSVFFTALLGVVTIAVAQPITLTVAFNVSQAPEWGDERYDMEARIWRELGTTGVCSNSAQAGGTRARDTHDIGVIDVEKDVRCQNPEVTISFQPDWGAPKQTVCRMTYDKQQGVIVLSPDNKIIPGSNRLPVQCHARMMGSHLVLMVNDLG